uniref:Uncharacterized protein n=1 Tax=Meloidogyne enterolobii TaxID=390850 RepID=A0A6V7VPM7_MELEN|nr:unnamed protein product [Meloidogyne enterolobii]
MAIERPRVRVENFRHFYPRLKQQNINRRDNINKSFTCKYYNVYDNYDEEKKS